MQDVGIIGGGITGLTAAYRLRQAGYSVTVYDAGEQPGGQIQTLRSADWLLEQGPNTVRLNKPELRQLLYDLGLQPELIYPDPAAKQRYIARGGVPTPLPLKLKQLLTSRLFGWRSKGQILTEPWRKSSLPQDDEPLAQMLARRLPQEVIDYAVNPFVGGVFAGSPDTLSAQYALPQLYEALREHGSLIRGQMAQARALKARGEPVPPPVFSFPTGLQRLPERLAAVLEGQLRLACPVQSISPGAEGWQVARPDGTTAQHEALLLTTPAHSLPALNPQVLPVQLFEKVAHPPVTVLSLGYRREDIAHPLDGFGVLVPEQEPYSLLGALFPSSLFPNRAPAGHVLLSCFLGGQRAPERALRAEEEQCALVQRDLQQLLGVRAEPVFRQHAHWPRAIPQYHVGYGRFLGQLQTLEEQHPGLYLAGSYRGGIGLPDRVVAGVRAAERIQQQAG